MRKALVAMALLVGLFANAQNDKRAATILDAMSNKYKTMTSFKVAFTYINEGTKETLKGDATVKGTKFRLNMAGQEIFNEGKIMTTYIKESNEATVNNYAPKKAGDIDPTKV